MQGVFLDSATMKPEALDLSGLRAALPQWRFHETTTPAQLHERIADATVVLTNKVVLDRAALEAASHLKLICVCATGTNNVDLDAARERGIPVCNVRDYAAPSVAQHTVALMLALATRWHDYHRDVASGVWSRSPVFTRMDYPVVELAGRNLGIVGRGSLGRRVAALGEALGMRVRFARSLRPGAPPEPGRVPLSALLAQADVLSLHCPLTEQTRGLIDRQALAAMKRSAFLINTARGDLVDEPALAEALRRGDIAGAALDVLSQEPPPADHPLLAADIPNLLITPHNAWVSTECRQRLLNGVVENIRAWRGGTLRNCVNGLEAA